MPPVYRPWISPYGDDDFDWDPKKNLATFEERDFVFEAARVVFRGPLVRRQEYPAPEAGAGTTLHGARRVVRPGGGDYLYPARPQMPYNLDAASKRPRA